jgi:spore germination protein AB
MNNTPQRRMVRVQRIPERFQVSPFLVFFLVHSVQVGIGVLGYQRSIAKAAGYDGWISVILAGVLVHILVWMMYKIMERGNGDLISVHRYIFGNFIGSLFSLVFILYFTMLAITIIRTYIQIIQVWMFPDIKIWMLAIFIVWLVYYIVSGGFRIVTGVCFLEVVLPLYLIFTFFYALEFIHPKNLLPIFDHSIKEISISTKEMTLSVLGFEALLMFYPFIKNPEKSKKWAHYGVLVSTLMYLFLALLTFMYFSEEQLQENVWPTLQIWKIVEMPIVERFEYIGIANWCFIILPNACLTIWAASRGAKLVFHMKQRNTLIILLLICFIAVVMIDDHQGVKQLSNWTSKLGLYLVFVYIPILFFVTLILQKVRGKKK